MKKIISALFVILTLSGCASTSKVKPQLRGITFSADITYYNESYEADVTVDKSLKTTVSFTSPDSLDGLVFEFSDDDVTVNYKGLSQKYDIDAIPEGIAATLLYEIIEDADDDDARVIEGKDTFYISGDTDGTEYRLYLGATGLPISAEDPRLGFKVNFKNVTLK